ncbi:2Fe-2S iron-sulfur cluster binding domain-containing protein [Paenibacillus lycopersici]|uniref:2Fe-2S iron-sulfur cluster binding domain-containing protein n=1 Tax=Paenibacillus lycopersici TaxID=2704462 RepID=A0A6C0FTP0_9BACL|nr:2Fe-2S iron-sulfur cluster-binding protein [Paenibacillus lycopersici]QHT60526.1 2Fe-2S iron-sulfur cluster binding domain-containing protein [Paenibacillus lycopersici]
MNVEITFLPSGRSVLVRAGTTVLDASRKAGVPIRTRCDGKAACLMCKVTMPHTSSGLSPLNDNERRKLAGLERSGTRLACQTRVFGRAVVEVPEDPYRAAVRKQMMRQAEDDELW